MQQPFQEAERASTINITSDRVKATGARWIAHHQEHQLPEARAGHPAGAGAQVERPEEHFEPLDELSVGVRVRAVSAEVLRGPALDVRELWGVDRGHKTDSVDEICE